MRSWPLLTLVLLVTACPKESDYTPQIRVAPGDRTKLLPRGRREAEEKQARPARVHAMQKGEELGGSNAIGRPGDIVLENDEVVFVIDRLGSSAGFAESGGNIVDAADARTRKDELGQVFTYFGTFPRQGVYEQLDTKSGPDGSAYVVARGRELYDTKIEVTTIYKLSPNDRAVLITTTLKNAGDKPSDKLSLGDAIQWGGAEKFMPGKPVGFKGTSSGPFIGGLGRTTSYAIASTDGDVDGISGGSWTDTAQRKDVVLAPGESASFSRVLLVGERPDAASLLSELTKVAGGKVGALEISLVDAAGKPVDAPPGAKAIVYTREGAAIMSVVAPAGGAAFAGEVPPGQYLLAYASGGGRKGAGDKVPIEIAADKVAKATLAVTAAGAAKLACAELRVGKDGRQNRVRGPCKVTFEGLEGTPAPDFGPPHAAGPAKNQVTTDTGDVELPLSPGKYRVTMSRGPEYSIAQVDFAVSEGATAEPCAGDKCTIARVVDTASYVATDFHQHTMLGADAPVAIRDRVIANVAEGVEIAVASEHNFVADFSPLVREMHLGAHIVAVPGNEITTDALRKPWGHVNAFPLVADPSKPRNGAVVVKDRTAKEVLAEVRALPGAPILQVNHPRTGITGYFEQLKLDPKTGVGTEPGYDPQFDALEVWNGRNVDDRNRVIDDFFTLLATKHPTTATADTDTHGVVGQEAGYPRTYVRVGKDDDLDAWDASRAADLVQGVRGLRDVVLTNGPFLRVTANGKPIGAIAKAAAGHVELKVHVECAPWIQVEEIGVARAIDDRGDCPAGSACPARSAIASATVQPVKLKPTPSGAMGADVVVRVAVAKDNAIVVFARGSKPMTPVLGGDPKEIAPFAMTGAIWIDADGDGKSLGR